MYVIESLPLALLIGLEDIQGRLQILDVTSN
jgi:hypothetical protein